VCSLLHSGEAEDRLLAFCVRLPFGIGDFKERVDSNDRGQSDENCHTSSGLTLLTEGKRRVIAGITSAYK
jgi:hypothetical protein